MNQAFKLAPPDWALLRTLLDQALALPANERTAWLARLDDAQSRGLRSHLAALLANADDAGTSEAGTAARLLATLPKVETGQFAPPPGAADKAGDRVGPYRLICELGSGGMGSVWLAERTDLLQGRQVALKLPHGAWKRAGLAERLAREREILATLEHPNIARLYDAGVTAEGQPWLALEYVDGERIDAYCQRKQLGVKERLHLFAQVARAVAQAHAQLVVHRDLKPANILVTEAGDVKLLDFGIAKLVAEGAVEETELTREVGRAFTPEYASPEQILGKPLGTASDVYSLGVVLFELLADVRPYRLARSSRAALEEAVAEADVPRPSTLAPAERRRALRGDLDTIVLKALKREPAERYATVAALADDVQRHLEQRPVLAQPDRAWYRVRTFVRRHRWPVAAAALTGMALLTGVALFAWQASIARAEQVRADQVKAFIASIFADANPYESGGGAPSAVDLLQRAERKLGGQVGASPATRIELLNTLVRSFVGLRQLESAERLAKQAVAEARQSLPADAPQSLAARRLWSSVLLGRGRSNEALQNLDELIPALERAGEPLRGELFEALSNRVHSLIDAGRAADAVAAARAALALATELHGERSVAAATIAAGLATALRFARRSDEAVVASERAVQLVDAAFADEPRHPIPAQTRMGLASALADAGDVPRGARELRAAIVMAEERQGADHPELGYYHGNLALMLLDLDDAKGAERSVERAFALLMRQTDRASTTFGAMLQRRAAVQLALRRPEAALGDLAQAVQVFSGSLGPHHDRTTDARLAHARALAAAGRGEEARAEFTALPAAAASAPHGSRMRTMLTAAAIDRATGVGTLSAAAVASLGAPTAESRRQFAAAARAATALALVQLDHGRHVEAAMLLEQARHWLREFGVVEGPDTIDVQFGLGRAALSRGAVAEALPHLRAADEFWVAHAATHVTAGEVAYWFARALAASGDLSGARLAYGRAVPGLAASKRAADAPRLAEARAAVRRGPSAQAARARPAPLD